MIFLQAQLVRPGLHVGPAFPADVEAIANLLVLTGLDCLPVGAPELLRRLGEFEVARSPSGRVVGCASVHGSDDRTELRCVAVHPSWRGRGVGRLLVRRAIQRASTLGEELFCVSRKPRFFESLGFSRLPPEAVPARPEASRDGPRRCALICRLNNSSPTEAVA